MYEMDFTNGIATFTIRHPQHRNAISTAVADGLEKFISTVEKEDTTQFVVITGSDGVFCSGGDVAEYQSLWTADDAYPMLSRMAGLLYRLATLPVPTIAHLNGTAVGGGCEIATACDYRLMNEQAKAGFIQGTIALTTGWGGATLLMEKMAQYDAQLSLLSEARVLSAKQLAEIGWVTHIYEKNETAPVEQFIATQQKIHPSVHRAYKKMAIRKWERTQLKERMLEEAKGCAVLWEAEEHHHAVAQFLNKS
ncbi:MAG TPA: enoyl-CoA hydratase/isomerase family protein [Sporosarcina sp.]|nr:enoyl-CoA hydratase/isomerase family protein [Sporosarcina sp.]